MVVTNAPNQHPDVPVPKTVIYEEVFGGTREDMRITAWEKTQELRSGKCTLWDHCFELPGTNLEAEQSILRQRGGGQGDAQAQVGGNDKLEIYDYPGGYAQRFDGMDRGGAPRPAELQKIFEDNERTVKIRMEQEAVAGLAIQGGGNAGSSAPGTSSRWNATSMRTGRIC